MHAWQENSALLTTHSCIYFFCILTFCCPLFHPAEICGFSHLVVMRLLRTDFILVTWLWLPLNDTFSGSRPRANSSSLWSISVKWLQTLELSNWVTSNSHCLNQTCASFQTSGSKTFFWSVFTCAWPLITDELIESEQAEQKLTSLLKGATWNTFLNLLNDVLPSPTPGWKSLI